MKMNVIIIAVLVVLCLGYFVSERNIRQSEGFIGLEPGRFVLTVTGDGESVLILDSQEGNLWVVWLDNDPKQKLRRVFYPNYTGQARLPGE